MNWLADVQIFEKLQVKVTLCDAMRTYYDLYLCTSTFRELVELKTPEL